MKTLIAAALLLALTVPAAADDNNVFYWDCGGVKISAGGEGEELAIKFDLPLKGTLKWDFQGRGRDYRVWLNGKACTRVG